MVAWIPDKTSSDLSVASVYTAPQLGSRTTRDCDGLARNFYLFCHESESSDLAAFRQASIDSIRSGSQAVPLNRTPCPPSRVSSPAVSFTLSIVSYVYQSPGIHVSARRNALSKFTMPAMSPTMTEGGIAEWKKKEGETFVAGDVLLEIVCSSSFTFTQFLISTRVGNRQGNYRRRGPGGWYPCQNLRECYCVTRLLLC